MDLTVLQDVDANRTPSSFNCVCHLFKRITMGTIVLDLLDPKLVYEHRPVIIVAGFAKQSFIIDMKLTILLLGSTQTPLMSPLAISHSENLC